MAKPRLALVLANSFAVRNTLHTPVLGHLAAQGDLEVTILTSDPEHARVIQAAGASHLSWAPLHRPVEGVGLGYGGPWSAARRLAQRLAMRPLLQTAGFGNLVYRFNEILQLKGHLLKKELPPHRRAREAQAGNFVDPGLGRPWPRSQAMLRLLYGLYYATWYDEPTVEAFFDHFHPHLLALHHLQFASIRPYNTSARRRGIPILGIVASWDQPTTKGPLCPGVSRYLVQSRQMREELARFHGVDLDRVTVTGWPQLDLHQQPGVLQPRAEFLAELGLPPDRRLILLAANSARLGAHEPGIAAQVAAFIAHEPNLDDVTLVVRPHPNDSQWRERFGYLADPPRVLVLAAEWGRLNFLANLLRHAQLVMASSAGSVCLDAISLDACTIGLGFDGDLNVPPHLGCRRWFELDHFAPVVQSGGVRLVACYPELFLAIEQYLANPGLDAIGRERCRQEQLEPLDGRSSERVVEALVSSTYEAARGGKRVPDLTH